MIIDGLFDDGIVVYLNGKEIGRNSMPAGVIDWQTPGIRTEAKYKTILESDVSGYLKTEKMYWLWKFTMKGQAVPISCLALM